MKNLFFAIAIAILASTAAYAQYDHNIQLNDGTTIIHSVTEIDSISFGTDAVPVMHLRLLNGNVQNFGLGLINQVIFQGSPAGSIASLDCAAAIITDTLTQGIAASGVIASIPYTGGNGGTYGGQTIGSTGVSGLTATLAAGTFDNGNGTLTFIITGTPQSSGTASFAINIGGQTCTLTVTVNLPAGTIVSLNCGAATINGTLTQGVAASGVSSAIPYTGGNGGTHNGQTVQSTGVSGLTATLAAGTFDNGNGTLTFIITGTPQSSGTASFAINIGGQTCTLTVTVNLPAGTVVSLNCGAATINGTLTQGVAADGISASIPYTGGNGGTHNGQTVQSTGVSGLTATLAPGTFANGNDILTFSITGTPQSSGTASLAINIGGQTCTLTIWAHVFVPFPSGTVHCIPGGTAVVEVVNPITGETWMDRNLGASQAATASNDPASYGDLYQWGRFSDGHQCRTSETTFTNATTATPNQGNSWDGKFIREPSSPNNWLSSQNNNLWQGVNGINNPCPEGYRLPTDAEVTDERESWTSNNRAGAFDSPLKLPTAGFRYVNSGSLYSVGFNGYYWSGTVSGTFARSLLFLSSSAYMFDFGRARGLSVRCLKD